MSKKAITYTEYRVLSSRVGYGVTDKRYRSLKHVNDRIGRLTSPEPWRFYGSEEDRQRSGDDYNCCAGTRYDECSCGGFTVAQHAAEQRKGLPPIEWITVSSRLVTRHPWIELLVLGGLAIESAEIRQPIPASDAPARPEGSA